MPSWNEVLIEIQECKRTDALDFVRRKYLRKLYEHTNRNIIAYYSGWLQKPGIKATGINDEDKNGLMSMIHGMKRDKGLDLILHTPGGDIAATESIVDYLRKMFMTDIRVIVPQLALSAGTMIACASREIIMGKQSSLGPIDPQFNGISTYGVLEEFEKALEEIKNDPKTIPIWQVIVSKYHPTFIGDCQKAKDWSFDIVKSWLETGMFLGDQDATVKATKIANGLSDHSITKAHSRHIPLEECEKLGLRVSKLEDNNEFQDLVLTVHHAYMHTFASSSSLKIIENHEEKAMVQHQRMQQTIPVPQSQQGMQISVPLQGFEMISMV